MVKLLHAEELARLAGVHKSTVLLAIRRGELRASRTAGRSARIAPEDARAYLRMREKPIPAELEAHGGVARVAVLIDGDDAAPLAAAVVWVVAGHALAGVPLTLLHLIGHSLYKAHAFLAASSAVEVVLRYRHAADADWPFAFEASQYFTLTPQSLHVEMVVTNLAEVAQPVGLGWHPYFPKRARSRLHIELAERWDGDATGLPVRKVAQPGIDAGVAHLAFDNCFDGWHGAARIRDERFSLQLSSSLDRLVVYTPPAKDYFCVEPVSHVSNAIHMADPLAHGLRSLAPGESTRAWMQLDIAVV